MEKSYSPLTQLTTANLMIGGIAFLGWIAMALGAALGRLPNDLPERVTKFVDDAVLFAILLFGPVCFAAGVGLWKRRRWGRQAALSVGGVAGLLAVAGPVLAGLGIMQASNGLVDYVPLGLFAGYCGATFVILWDNPFGPATPWPPELRADPGAATDRRGE